MRRFTTKRRRLGAAALLALVALLAIGVGGAALRPGWIVRTTPPTGLRDAARDSHREALSVGAGKYAPAEFTEAETLLVPALDEYRRQELRLAPLRDFRAVGTRLAAADSVARLATALSRSRYLDSEERVQGIVRHAEETIALAEEYSRLMVLPSRERKRLAAANLALVHARGHLGAGTPREALAPALEADSLAMGVVAFAANRGDRFLDADRVRQWKALVTETVEASRRTGGVAIVVAKAERRLVLYRAGHEMLRFRIEGGVNNLDDKRRQGDRATPEGVYRVTRKKGRGDSRYYKALLLDYPNAEDRRRFEEDRRAGRIAPGVRIGGLIEIHGEGGRGRDWTDGCVALRNEEMDRLFDAVTVDTPVVIVGSTGGGGALSELEGRYRELAAKAGEIRR